MSIFKGMNKLNKKQRDLILKCAIDVCGVCEHINICDDVLKCELRMTLEGCIIKESEEDKTNTFHVIYEVI